jgi:purine-cytosine permease-like protein
VNDAVQLNAKPKVTEIEQFGVNTIPDADRTSTPWDLFRIQFGGANTFATVLLGTFPILFGLSFWQAVAATVLGVLVGTLFLMPMGIFGPRTGTNNAVSSGAHLGVTGRIAGSFLSLLTAIAFYSISVWVSGDAIVGAMTRMLGIQGTPLISSIIYGVIGFIVIVVVVYGYQFMLLVNRVAVIANTVLMLLAIVAFWGVFNPNFAGTGTLFLGSFWPTFILSALVVMSNPISFGAFLGDWARYIPRGTSNSKLMLATLGAQLATLVPFLFGVATATLVTGNVYVVGLITQSPLWYAILLIFVAFIGGLSTGTTSLYGTGLDFSSVFPRMTRVQSTIAIGSLAFIFIVVGRLVTDLSGAVNAFIGAIVVMTTPWMIVMTLGYATRRGYYATEDLQVFNQGKIGGKYWFSGGINWRGMVAWLGGAGVGLMFAYYPPVIVGPWNGLAGGIDLSLVSGILTAAVLYLGALFLFPEPDYVFGPKGPWLVPSKPSPVPMIVDNENSAAAKAAARRNG